MFNVEEKQRRCESASSLFFFASSSCDPILWCSGEEWSFVGGNILPSYSWLCWDSKYGLTIVSAVLSCPCGCRRVGVDTMDVLCP